ncbi:claudin-15 [Podarcis raffonei]|uniref:claudin-15 n=1 Tax=Podarcis muralis TaxID=64176 RepID=UPI0010A0198A|nr:claudin-15 [Podarcis muralis]XP_053218010.1 claudin-15 [Podarcis raffonei]
MSVMLETVGFFMATIGCGMLGITLFNSYWRVSTISGNVITTSTIFENLWQSCATDSTGVYNCWEFQSLLELPAYLQASRALMISALVLGFLGILCGMLGLQCTKVAEGNPNVKAKMAALAGCMFILAGICGMVTISWYAFNITRDFFNPLFVGTKYEIGPALYLGWSASLLVIIGGGCLFSSCKTHLSQDKSYTYPYKAPKSVLSAPTNTAPRPRRESNASSNGKYGKNAYV